MQRVGSSPGGPSTLFKGVGLVAVAIVSGLVWWLIRHDDVAAANEAATQEQSAPPAGEFQFSAVSEPVSVSDCVANSYGKIKDWFAEHPCTKLDRTLHVTDVEGKRALVSVALVTMPDQAQATQLKAITDTDNTGNVNDLVRDGSVQIPGAPNVAQGEYQSKADGATVTIVEANFFDGHEDAALLPRIANDAVRLGGSPG